MKIYKISAIAATILLALVFTACPKEKDNNVVTAKEFALFIDFWNPNGDNPQIRFDGDNSSPEIKIDFDEAFAGEAVPPYFTHVIIDNVRIIDANNVNYKIDSIIAYEWREELNNWKVDVEFRMHYEGIEELDVMMVLDASASLGADFYKVQEYAKGFVSKIFENSFKVRVGVVEFSTDVNTLGLSDNEAIVNNYISAIQPGEFTALYEAMNTGIDILQLSDAQSKSILTFTDGTDNNSDPQYTPAYLVDKLVNDENVIKVNSFTIGLEGDGQVDAPILRTLAANGGVAAFPKTIEELGSVFEDFSNSIANVYNLTYVRNQQKIPLSNPAKLKFVIRATPK